MMKNKTGFWILMIVLLFALLLPAASVSAKEIVSIKISGPGLDQTLELNNEEAIELFSFSWLMGQIDTPVLTDELYYEIELAVGDGTQVVASNIYYYYPTDRVAQYVDVVNGSSTAESYWYEVSEQGSLQLRDQILAYSLDTAQTGPVAMVRTWMRGARLMARLTPGR